MFTHYTVIHSDTYSRGACFCGVFFIVYSVLHPYMFDSHFDGLIDYWTYSIRFLKYIY